MKARTNKKRVGAAVALSAMVVFTGYALGTQTAVMSSPGPSSASCSTSETLKGVSRYFTDHANYPGNAHGMFCYNGSMTNATSSNTFNIASSGYLSDSIKSPSWGEISSSDWDYGYVKAECNNYEQIRTLNLAGSGSWPGGSLSGSCMYVGPAYGNYVTSCHRLDFGSQDNRESNLGGDWDSTFDKNQCADNEVVKGYSVYSSGKIRSILCCSYYSNN